VPEFFQATMFSLKTFTGKGFQEMLPAQFRILFMSVFSQDVGSFLKYWESIMGVKKGRQKPAC